MMNDFITPDIRKQYGCTLVDETWRCRCGSVLTPSDAVACPACTERSRVADDERRREERRQEFEARARAYAKRVLDRLPVWPPDKAAFEAEVTSPDLRKVARVYEPKHGNLLLAGPTGLGKTAAATVIMRRLTAEALEKRLADPSSKTAHERFQAAREMLWVSAFDLVESLGKFKNDTDGLFLEAKSASLLAVDELGFEAHTNRVYEMLYARVVAGKSTIVTTGMTEAEFIGRYGAQFWRRLTQKGLGRLVDLHTKPRSAGAA